MMRENWIEIELQKIAKINPKKPSINDDQDVTFLPMPLVEEETGKYHLKETRKYFEVKKGYTGFIEGDLLFAKITPCMENGKIAVVNKLVNSIGYGSTEFHVVRPSKAIYNKYLFHFLVRRAFRGYAQRKMTGSAGQLRVPKSVIEEAILPLAPLPEQRAIVAKIEQLLSDLDNGIANLKTAKSKLEIYRQAVLKKAFEGELTKEWREGQNLNNDWINLKINKIGKIVTGNTPSKKNNEYYSNHEYNFYKPTDLEAGESVTQSHDGLSLKGFKAGRLAPENSILVTCIGATIGKTGLIKKKGCFNQQINAIIPIDGYNPKFIYYQVIGINFQTQIKTKASSTTLPILNKGKFSELLIRVCSLREQAQIVQEVDSRLSVCDKLSDIIDQSLKKSEALRQSILKKAFEGKLLSESELKACRNEHDWEPAYKLLERVKKEKVKSSNITV